MMKVKDRNHYGYGTQSHHGGLSMIFSVPAVRLTQPDCTDSSSFQFSSINFLKHLKVSHGYHNQIRPFHFHLMYFHESYTYAYLNRMRSKQT